MKLVSGTFIRISPADQSVSGTSLLKHRQWAMTHARGCSQCRYKRCDCGYYNLHRDVNNSLPLHNSQLSIINYQLSISVAPANALISVAQVVVVVRAAALVLTTILRGSALAIAGLAAGERLHHRLGL